MCVWCVCLRFCGCEGRGCKSTHRDIVFVLKVIWRLIHLSHSSLSLPLNHPSRFFFSLYGSHRLLERLTVVSFLVLHVFYVLPSLASACLSFLFFGVVRWGSSFVFLLYGPYANRGSVFICSRARMGGVGMGASDRVLRSTKERKETLLCTTAPSSFAALPSPF